MNEEVRKRLEYEEQFFGMSSRFFADSFKNFVKDELDEKVNMMVGNIRDKLIKECKNTDKFTQAVEEMKKNLKEEYYKSLDDLFPEIESKISTFMQIPDNVLLKEDLIAKDGINKDLDVLKEEVENLEGTYKSLLYLKQEMLEESDEADSAIFAMEYALNKKGSDFEVLPVKDLIALSKENNHLLN